MVFQIRNNARLLIRRQIIDLLNLLQLHAALHPPGGDLVGVEEPDGAVLVLHELAADLQDLVLVHFLDVVAHLVDQFQTEQVLVFLQHFCVRTELFVVVEDFCIRACGVDWGVELYYVGSAAAERGLHVGLYALYTLPEVVVRSTLENLIETVLVHYLH